jgi:hypothetical protein
VKDRRCPKSTSRLLTEAPVDRQCMPAGTAAVVYTQEVNFAVGTWLSLVEHSLGVRGVGSSNLPVPTIKINNLTEDFPTSTVLRVISKVACPVLGLPFLPNSSSELNYELATASIASV